MDWVCQEYSIYEPIKVRTPIFYPVVKATRIFTVRNSSCGKGYVFTPVCQSFCSQELWADTPLLPPPQANTPPPRRPPQRTLRILLECILVTINLENISKFCQISTILKDTLPMGPTDRLVTTNI